MRILDNVINLLHEQNKSQKELTDFLGISKNVFTDWKSGKNKSYKKHLPEIAMFLNVTVDYLLGNEEHSSNNQADELDEYLEELRTRPELKMLFSLTKNATKQDVEKAVKIIEALIKE